MCRVQGGGGGSCFELCRGVAWEFACVQGALLLATNRLVAVSSSTQKCRNRLESRPSKRHRADALGHGLDLSTGVPDWTVISRYCQITHTQTHTHTR